MVSIVKTNILLKDLKTVVVVPSSGRNARDRETELIVFVNFERNRYAIM